MDQAATSYPKPEAVIRAMADYMTSNGASLHRGSGKRVQEVEFAVLNLRERLCALFNHDSIKRAILTSGATMALNTVLFGSLKGGDHVLVDSLAHNAVVRPLFELKKRGVTFSKIPVSPDGLCDLEAAEGLITPSTRMLILTHASNVCGTIQDAEAFGRLCKKHDLLYVLDAAQAAGHIPVDFTAFNLDALAVPSHKGLLGPAGIGALLLSARLAQETEPLVFGGTGSLSASETQPELLPDKFESGTPNLPALFGFLAAIESIDLPTRRRHELELSSRFTDLLSRIPNLRLLGSPEPQSRVAVFSLDFLGQDNGIVAARLENEFNIYTRSGLHCAPWAHQALGSFPQGAVRFSFSNFTTCEEVDLAADAVAGVVGSGGVKAGC
ncbi:MAG: aminotransferase class V-fold PLP-dependent enzyme [Clostridia bacterium]|nr:aminotransferase class V-fold PLP-dependent enzyme [Clostridia bacterium]